MSSIKSGLFWNSLQQIGLLGFSFLSTIILARLLTPEDYGLFGILMIFISISQMLSDSGIGGYIIKKQNITPIYYSTLFVYNLCISVCLYLILFFIAPVIAQIYENEMITKAIRVIGLVIIFYAFSITQASRLLKELRFKQMAIIGLSAGAIGLASALYLGYKGFGVWALVAQQLINAGLTSILYVCVNRNIPKLQFNWSVFKEEFGFGGFLFASSIFQTITNNLSNNFIGKFFSLYDTGMYVQANRLQNFPNNMVVSVVDRTFFPVFSKFNDDIVILRDKVGVLRRRVFAFLFPIFGLIIAFGSEIVYILLGEKWAESNLYFKCLMISLFPMIVKAMNRNVLKSTGNTSKIFIIEVISTFFLISLLFVSYLLDSILFVVFSFVITQFIAAILSVKMAGNSINESSWIQYKEVLTFLPIAIVPVLVNLVVPSILIIRIFSTFGCLIVLMALYFLKPGTEYRWMFNVLTRKINNK